MKKKIELIGIIAIVAIIGLTMASCGDSSSGDPSSPGHTHKWSAWGTKSTATCTEAEIEARTCSCGKEETRNSTTTLALGHNWNPTSVTVSEGVETKTCMRTGCNENNFIFNYSIGDTGPASGIIIYVADGLEEKALGFTVTGIGSFIAYYLEAAPYNQATSVTWCTCTNSSPCDITTGTAIGTGRANTDAIIAHTNHPGNTVSNNAAVAAKITIGGKSDWFLPSKDELNEIYKARTHLGISLGYFWSSSQNDNEIAWYQDFGDGYQGRNIKEYDYYVRAVRAF